MKKSITLLHVLEHLIFEEDVRKILETHGYVDTAHKLTVQTLVQFFVMAAVHEWKSFRHTADISSVYGLPSVHYSALSKKQAMYLTSFLEIFS